MKNQVINKILDAKMVVIVRGIDSDKIIPLAEAMYEGGVRALEITYNASNMEENTTVAGNIKKLVDKKAHPLYNIKCSVKERR